MRFDLKRFAILALILFSTPTSLVQAEQQTKFDQNNWLQDIQKIHDERFQKLQAVANRSELKDTKLFQKALQQAEQGHGDASQKLLERISKNSILKDYRDYHLAKIHLKQKDAANALKLLPSISNPIKKIDFDRFWLRQEALALAGQEQSIETETAPLLKKYRKDKWVQIKSSFAKGMASFHKGHNAKAKVHFENILVKNPGTLYDQRILTLLKSRSTPDLKIMSAAMWNLRAEQLIKNGSPHKALEIWQGFYKNDSKYEERVAYGFHRSRDYRESAKRYEALLKNGNHQLSEPELLELIAQAYSRYDAFEEAIKTNKDLLKKFPQSRQASLARFKLGFLYFDSEQYKKAADYFAEFTNKGGRWQQDRARWFRLWSFYLTKQYEQASKEIENLRPFYRRNKNDLIMLDYWQARVFEKQNQKSKAQALYKKIMLSDPVDYYGLLAKQRLQQKSLNSKTLIDPKMLSHFPAKINLSKQRSKSLEAKIKDHHLKRAILLAGLGLDNYAFDETRFSVAGKSVPSLEQLMQLQSAQNYHRGYAVRKLGYSGQIAGAQKDDVFAISFPLAYQDYILPHTKMWDLDQALPFAIMRQESTFKPEALSWAAAYGLMQIIPPTAEEIAGLINYRGFVVEDLNRPMLNTLFGTFYLKHLLDQLDDTLVYAIAGYNAGPDAIQRWRKKAPNMEMDEFIELIPYIETNKYVKKVLVNYLLYKRFYF
ncbi:MAG: transglycosylase SLT domain-containing protein [Deltaproteobacteria bacterium]|nr:transglycosylase SLT domain-containing protein [Deltaproteobacteria bacterium]